MWPPENAKRFYHEVIKTVMPNDYSGYWMRCRFRIKEITKEKKKTMYS